MRDFEVTMLPGTAPAFQGFMRPYLHHGGIARDLDARVEDKPGKLWWLAIAPDDRVLGFCGARLGNDEEGEPLVDFETFWVQPARRGCGVGRALFAARLAAYPPPQRIRGWCSKGSKPFYDRAGFTAESEGGHETHDWWQMRRG